jgi:dihydrofolate reductase
LQQIDQDPVLSANTETTFIIGGGQIYKEALSLPQCNLVYFTTIHKDFPCDTFFSSDILDSTKFALENPLDQYEMRQENDIQFQYLVYKKL